MFYNPEPGILKVDSGFPITLGTIGKSLNNIDYSKDKTAIDKTIIRKQEMDILSNYLDIKKRNIIMLNQVHGDSIIVYSSPVSGNRSFRDGDGMISDINEACLVLRTADCVPVFVFDSKNKVIGAAHSGWRGCRLNISGKLIGKMKLFFNSKVIDLHVFILPSIGPESYTVNTDVGVLFENDIILKGECIYLDLWHNINNALMKDGIPESNIHLSGICTYRNNIDYFSHRQGDSGRNLNFCFIDGSFNKR